MTRYITPTSEDAGGSKATLIQGTFGMITSCGLDNPSRAQITNLSVDESFLTGESLAVEKVVEPLPANIPVSERLNLAFAGSTVMSGRAKGVVTATGLQTEVGKIAETVAGADTTKPPLVVRMETFARQISMVVMGACVLLAMVGLAKGMPWLDVFFLAVALAVSAIPEGLPVAMTVALSIATNRMAKRNVIVRRLTAVEGLGSCTFIASDKTGTLTVTITINEWIIPFIIASSILVVMEIFKAVRVRRHFR